MFFAGLFGTMALASGPINYNEQDKMLVTPAVCQAYNDSLDLALTSYAVGQPVTEIVTLLDKSIIENIKDDDQYLGRTLTSMNIAVAIKLVRSLANGNKSMSDKLTAAKSVVNEEFISCRQDVGKTRGAYRRN
ncbi:hypothetical protein D9M71_329350 [compost metagenome]